MMIFNSFTVANDYNFGARWPSGRGCRFFLATNKTFESFFERSCEFFLYLKSFCKKRIIKFGFKLIYEQVN